MSSQNQLKYQISQVKLFKGQGDISNITNQILNKSFKLISNADDEFKLQLKLTKPSIITEIKFKFIDVYQYEIKFRKLNKQIVWENHAIVRDQKQSIKIDKSQTTNFVQIILRNNIHNLKRMGIIYVILEGFNDQTKQVQKRHNKKYSMYEQQAIVQLEVYDFTIKPKIDHSKEMFQSRLKQGKYTQAKQSKYTQAKQSQYNEAKQSKYNEAKQTDLRKKQKLNQDHQKTQRQIRKLIKQKKQKQQQQTQLALALSRSQKIKNFMDEQIQRINQDHLEEQIPQALRQYGQCIEKLQEYQQRQYEIVDKDQQYLTSFSCLNSKWLQAQRKAQQQANVRQNQRLSNFINLKHLYQIEIYVDGFPEWQKEQIKINADKLGCKLIKELKSNCFVFVSKELLQKTRKKSKHLNGVKYLRIQYLQSCIRQRKRLNPTDFYYKV